MHLPTLTLFDLTALTPDQPTVCAWCKRSPATTSVRAARNLLGLNTTPVTRRDAFERANSGPCCDSCARYLAGVWWDPIFACPTKGRCHLWGHTLTAPRPAWDCPRHHHEAVVVWLTPLRSAS